MSQFNQRLIFREKDVLLQDFCGREIKTFQRSYFLTQGGCYRVTKALLGNISGKLLIEINVPIEVSLTFKGEINANVPGAIANADADGAKANANVDGAIANANFKGAIANANVKGATANANRYGAVANANADGATANANVKGATANANRYGATANAKVPGASIGYDIG